MSLDAKRIPKTLLWLFVILGASGNLAAEQVYNVKGIVRGPVDQGAILIEHEEIKGFMPAMTMPFYLAEGEPKTQLNVGDTVEFRFVIASSGSRAETFNVIKPAVVERESSVAATDDNIGKLFPNVALQDESGRPLGIERIKGNFTVVTFIFTRCPIPEFCPILATKFGRLQTLLDKRPTEAMGNTRLLSVTLDPDHDTPEVLADYGKLVGANPKRWNFATGTKMDIESLAALAGLHYSGKGLGITHQLKTLLINPDGRLTRVWSGNRWKAEEIIDEIRSARRNDS